MLCHTGTMLCCIAESRQTFSCRSARTRAALRMSPNTRCSPPPDARPRHTDSQPEKDRSQHARSIPYCPHTAYPQSTHEATAHRRAIYNKRFQTHVLYRSTNGCRFVSLITGPPRTHSRSVEALRNTRPVSQACPCSCVREGTCAHL